MKSTIILLASILLSGSAAAQDLVLFKAIREKRTAEVERLLNTGKVELEPPYRPTFVNKPLAYAAAYGNLEIVKLILAKGADVNGQVAYGNAPLHEAAEAGSRDIVIHLIEKGADVNLPNDFGLSTFVGLCGQPGTDAALIKLILAHGGKVNEAHRTNYRVGKERPTRTKTHTPLQAAVVSASPEIVQLLLDAGGDPSLKDAKGKTCFDLAQARPEVLALLKARQKN